MQIRGHLENLVQDIRYAARGLARRPSFTAVAVLTMAIGVGATTTIFTAVNALLLRPLPFRSPGDLRKISLSAPAANGRPANDSVIWTYPRADMFRANQQVFTGVSLYVPRQLTITNGQVELLRGELVSANSTRVLQSLLFDLEASDPLTYLAALVVLGAAAVLASWIPARRASRVDPVTAFKTE